MIDKLPDIWTSLESEADGCRESAVLRRRLCPSSSNHIYVGLATPANQRLALFRVARGCQVDESDLPTSDGVRTAFITVPDDPANCVCLSVQLHDRQYADVFSSLVADLVATVRDAPDDRSLIDRCIERLRRWQAFMRMHGHDGLNQMEQRGLFGELWFLLEQLLACINPETAVDSWEGPSGRPQDFYLYGNAIEVKTTISKSHTVIPIANELQLDDTGLDRLVLGHLKLIESRTTSRSLVEMVAALREALAANPTARTKFEDRLLEAGYIDVHEQHYHRPTYRVREFNVYQVSNGFPRIVAADIMEGIGDLRYSVVVAGIERFKMNVDQLQSILTEAGHG